ncbi:MAG: MBL fold metallo-hydrolase [Woeseiaceae bacterium]
MPATPDYMNYVLDARPEKGSCIDISEGVRWLRMPLPFLLGHINLWLLDDGDEIAIVDSGLNSAETREHWKKLLEDMSVSQVIVTHMHPDHVGCAGWLTETYDAPLTMSRAEYLMCRVLVADTGKPAPQVGIDFYRSAGFSESSLSDYAEKFGGFGRAVSAMPDSFRRMQDGQVLTIGSADWEIITTSGHCPEHASLLCREKNLFIAGDQLLPTISSNVSVWPTEPNANPLQDWLDACHRLQTILPENVIVLPSHGKPFTGAHGRLQALIDEHETGLQKLRELCKTPQRVIDVFPALFKSRITDSNLIMATGEAIAHLNYLIARGEIIAETSEDGVAWYRLAH